MPRWDRCIIRSLLLGGEEENVALETVSIVFHNLRHDHLGGGLVTDRKTDVISHYSIRLGFLKKCTNLSNLRREVLEALP